jgi:hypothetical protein
VDVGGGREGGREKERERSGDGADADGGPLSFVLDRGNARAYYTL